MVLLLGGGRGDESDVRKIDFDIRERLTSAFLFGKHYVLRGGALVPCPLGDGCPGFPSCREGDVAE